MEGMIKGTEKEVAARQESLRVYLLGQEPRM